MVNSGCALPTSTLIYRKTYQETYHSVKKTTKIFQMKHVKTSFTAALPNNVLHFTSHLSLTSLRTDRLLNTKCKRKKVSPKDIHRGSVLLRRYIHETAQQGILRLLTKEFYWKVKTQTYISGNYQEVSQQTLNHNCLHTSYCSGNP